MADAKHTALSSSPIARRPGHVDCCYVRVTRRDGRMAWSSPIWVGRRNRVGKVRRARLLRGGLSERRRRLPQFMGPGATLVERELAPRVFEVKRHAQPRPVRHGHVPVRVDRERLIEQVC